jgi:O-antigen ligase
MYFIWPVCGAYAGMLFSITISNITLAILLAFCLATFSFSAMVNSIKGSRPIQLLLLFFLLHIPGLLYSQNLDNGWFVLEKKATLLLLPLFLFPSWQSLPVAERTRTRLYLGIITIGSSLVFLVLGLVNKFINDSVIAFHRDYFASIPYVFYSIYFSIGARVSQRDV